MVRSWLLGIGAATLSLAGCGALPPLGDGTRVAGEQRASAGVQDVRSLETRLLLLHNREREAVGVSPLVWDADLAAAAAGYARELAQSGRFAHSARETRLGQGENLWMGTRGAYSLEQMAGSWADEKRLFRAGTFPNVSTTGRWEDVAHYTQMIWRATARLGCALHQGASADFLVCRYAPPGNVAGQLVP